MCMYVLVFCITTDCLGRFFFFLSWQLLCVGSAAAAGLKVCTREAKK